MEGWDLTTKCFSGRETWEEGFAAWFSLCHIKLFDIVCHMESRKCSKEGSGSLEQLMSGAFLLSEGD